MQTIASLRYPHVYLVHLGFTAAIWALQPARHALPDSPVQTPLHLLCNALLERTVQASQLHVWHALMEPTRLQLSPRCALLVLLGSRVESNPQVPSLTLFTIGRI